MRKHISSAASAGGRTLELARVLLVHEDLAPRLALKTILEAGGYFVDVAATPADALSKLDECEYELVISDSDFGHRRAGRDVLAYARVKNYRPATALLTSYEPPARRETVRRRDQVAVHTEDVPLLLGEVAELIGARASRRYRQLPAN